MRKKIWKPFTIMVVPHSGKQVRTMSITKSLIISSAALLLMIGASGGYFFYKYSEYRNANKEFANYKTETEQIRKEYDSISGKAETVQKKLDALQQLENDLRAKNGLPPVNNKQDSGGKGGTLQSRSGLSHQFMVLNVDAINQLEENADSQVTSVQSTLNDINEKAAERKAEEQRKQYEANHMPDIWPTSYRNITSDFGYRQDPFGGFYALHTGIDIAGSYGSPIVTTAAGVVEIAGWDGGYGNSVLINHGNGLSTRYGHMSSLNVKVGQTVSKGDCIGFMGSTGRSTGIHVHYEVLVNGNVVNPQKYLP